MRGRILTSQHFIITAAVVTSLFLVWSFDHPADGSQSRAPLWLDTAGLGATECHEHRGSLTVSIDVAQMPRNQRFVN